MPYSLIRDALLCWHINLQNKANTHLLLLLTIYTITRTLYRGTAVKKNQNQVSGGGVIKMWEIWFTSKCGSPLDMQCVGKSFERSKTIGWTGQLQIDQFVLAIRSCVLLTLGYFALSALPACSQMLHFQQFRYCFLHFWVYLKGPPHLKSLLYHLSPSTATFRFVEDRLTGTFE